MRAHLILAAMATLVMVGCGDKKHDKKDDHSSTHHTQTPATKQAAPAPQTVSQ